MIYKTLKKVSDVCQLLDKSKLPNTQTIKGITYTVDKVNGTITANGTATADSTYKTDIALNNAESYTNGGGTKIPSRLLFLGCPIGGSQTTYGFYNNWVSSNVVDTGNGGITDTTSKKYNEYYRFSLRITIKQGYTANNLVFKPQLFDLTEMYGAGNEPTTVEEFREKFPNELYDYKPYCFVKSYKTLLKATDDKIITSYKKSLICTTKNLFDISKVFSAPTLCFDVSSLEIGKTYTFSSNKPIMVFKISDFRGGYNSVIYGSTNGFTTFTFVMARDEHIPVTAKQYLFLWLPELNTTGDINTSGYVTDISQLNGYNLQIELGDTATEYHPYGYL